MKKFTCVVVDDYSEYYKPLLGITDGETLYTPIEFISDAVSGHDYTITYEIIGGKYLATISYKGQDVREVLPVTSVTTNSEVYKKLWCVVQPQGSMIARKIDSNKSKPITGLKFGK